LVATLFHRGALTDRDVGKIALALAGYGAGLVGLVAIKVLAPAYYASQDIRTPVKIAVVVLVITQLLNLAFVPWLAHTGLALSIGIAALVNAAWLLVVLLRRGTYVPRPGWGKLVLQVLAASVLLAVLLAWSGQALDWIALKEQQLLRMGWLALIMAAAALLYFGALWAAGLKLRQLLHR
ncbi:MAG: lipid II flippase MurJ, partial [Comamonas sp.]